MRQRVVLLAVLCLWPAVSYADGISAITPRQLYVGSVEEFITARGTGLLGLQATFIELSGKAGTRILEPNAIREIETEAGLVIEVTSWLPAELGSILGTVSVTVLAVDSDTVTRRIGPATFEIVPFAIEQPPLLNVPEVVLAEAASPAGSNVSFQVFGLSFVDPSPVITCSRASGSLFPVGTTTVSCTATDSFASTTLQFVVVVADTKAPTLTVPASFITDNPVVTFTATASDAIDGPLTPECSPASGSTFPEGATQVVCTATDNSANSVTASFEVLVVVAPILRLPGDLVVEATGPDGAIVTFEATAIGGTITCSAVSGSLFPLGTTIVFCSATGPGGTSTGSFLISVVDTTPPQILRIEASRTELWPPNHAMLPIFVQVVARDLVSTNLISRIESITSNQPENGTGDGDTSPDWRILAPLVAELRAERSGNVDRIYTIHIVTEDEKGNRAMGTVQVKITQAARRRAS